MRLNIKTVFHCNQCIYVRNVLFNLKLRTCLGCYKSIIKLNNFDLHNSKLLDMNFEKCVTVFFINFIKLEI